MILLSTSCTSPLIRAMMSPLRSSLKKLRERIDLLVELVADVTHDTSTDRYDGGGREEISSRLQECHECQEQTDHQKGGRSTVFHDKFLDVIVHVVGGHFLEGAPVSVPGHIVVGTDAAIYLKQDLQDWYQGCE